ncbi:MAG: SDR family oxidoreductase [Planctomycetota bacterium]
MNLHGKTVLITGGRRIGAKLARQLAERGANIALSYLTSRDALNELAVECRQLGVRAETFRADLRSADEAERLVEWTVTTFGSVDVLVNLTSIYTCTPFATLRPEDYEAMLAANLTAPYWVAIAAGRAMLRQPIVEGLQGKIIHFTDWSVDRPYRDFLPYLIAKGGLVTLTKALAVELAPTITVNAVAPGTVEPPPGLSESKLQEIRDSSALGRIGSANDVIQAVLYLLEGTDFATGEVLRVDGGRFLGPPAATSSDLDQ